MASLNNKISEQGVYLPFFGYSVIMKINNHEKLRKFPNNIRKIFGMISPLPVETFHMTLYNIWSYKNKPISCLNKYILENPIEFNFFINNNFFLPTNYLYEEHLNAKKLLLKNCNITVRPKKIKIELNNNVLKCNLFFDEETNRILLYLHHWLEKIYNKKDCFAPHCTLGYVFKKFDINNLELKKHLYILEKECNKNLHVFDFSFPSVYMFSSMDDFREYLQYIN